MAVPSDRDASYVIGMGLVEALTHAAPDLPRERYKELAERYRHVLAFATTIHDRIYFLNERFGLFDIRIEGAELIDAALADGRGADRRARITTPGCVPLPGDFAPACISLYTGGADGAG